MDGFYLHADDRGDESTRCYRVGRRFVLLVFLYLVTARFKLIYDHVAWVWRRAGPGRWFTAQTESVVCRSTRRLEHVCLRQQCCGVKFQSLVVARWHRRHFGIVRRLLTPSLVRDGDDMNRVVILKGKFNLLSQINSWVFQFLSTSFSRPIYWVIKSFFLALFER